MNRRDELKFLREYKRVAENPDIQAVKYGRAKTAIYIISAALALFLYRAHLEAWISFSWQFIWAGSIGLLIGTAWFIGYSKSQIHVMSPYLDVNKIEERLNELET
ncbi:MAG: hypothetical protein ACRBCI_13765 [Cellvibrionaceae bacterium]